MSEVRAAQPSADVISLHADELPLVLPGEYHAAYVRHKGLTVFREPKVCIELRLLDYAYPAVLQRWYRVKDYRNGRIRASRTSDIVRDVQAALGRKIRPDRIPLELLAEMDDVLVEVRTVTKDYRQRELADINHYSVIERLLPKR